jgi:hypothetical protein
VGLGERDHPGREALVELVTRFAVRARRRQREAAAFLHERQQTAERQALLIRDSWSEAICQ